MNDREYLGDGVYMMNDGYYIWLYANDAHDPTDKVALEPHMIGLLSDYLKRMIEKAKADDQ